MTDAGPSELLQRAAAARAAGDPDGMLVALIAAFDAARAAGDASAMAAAALAFPTGQRFGVHPGRLPALLHEAYVAASSPPARCRLAAALARSWALGGDALRAGRFARESEQLASELDDPQLLADALDARLLTSWGPDDLTERVSLAARLDAVAAHLTDVEQRLAAHLWRLTTAWECLDIVAVQRQLRALDILAAESGSARVEFFAISRRAMHVLTSGDLPRADALIERAGAIGATVGEPDVEAVMHSLAADRAMQTADLVALGEEAAAFDAFGMAEGIPSVLAEAAVLLLASGQPDLALVRCRQLVAGGIDVIPRDVDFLLIVCSVIDVAAALGEMAIAADAAATVEPYAGRAVLNAGAVTFHGVVDEYLFRAEPSVVRWRDNAANAYRRIGAVWWEQRVRGRRSALVMGSTVTFRPDGATGWTVGGFTLPDLKGLHYLHELLSRPGVDIDAAALAGAGVDAADTGEILDTTALAAYRARLAEIEHLLDDADTRGDPTTSARLGDEREALLAELRAATGIGGRRRRTGSTDERARVAVRKAIAAAIARIEAVDPGLARMLRDTVRTGGACRYDPQPDRPVDWIL